MIVTLSGVTGTGKSFFKNTISEELCFKNIVIVTTREKRIGEINGIDKEFVSEEEFEKLDEEIKRKFEEKSDIVQEQIFEALAEIKAIEKASDKKIEEWQANIALLTINVHINSIKANYKRNKKLSTFLDGIKKDILKNISCFLEADTDGKNPNQNPRSENKEPWLNYRVNLFIDNSNLTGAPVIMDNNYSYHNIFGRLEYENQYGVLKTDYTMLKPGILHQANGGYIMFQAKDLLSNPACYEALKKALRTKELGIENALVTCRENNIASKKTMESFIGNSLSLVPSMYEGIMEYRYLIDVKENIKSNNKNK